MVAKQPGIIPILTDVIGPGAEPEAAALSPSATEALLETEVPEAPAAEPAVPGEPQAAAEPAALDEPPPMPGEPRPAAEPDPQTLIVELQTRIAAGAFELTDEIVRTALTDVEAKLYRQISARLREELPELVDTLLRERLERDTDA